MIFGFTGLKPDIISRIFLLTPALRLGLLKSYNENGL